MCENMGGIVDGESQGKIGNAQTGACVEEVPVTAFETVGFSPSYFLFLYVRA